MCKRLAALLVSGALLAACSGAQQASKAPPPPSERQALAGEVAALSNSAEGLLRAQEDALWRFWTDGTPIELEQSYRGQEDLFTLASLRKIDRLRELSRDPADVRALTQLHAHFAGEYLSRELAELSEALANLEASASFQLEGRVVRLRDLERTLANEKSALRRRQLYAAATPAVERLGATLRRKEERVDALVRELGYASYEAFGAELRQVDLVRLSLLAQEVLTATDAPYRQVMEGLAQRELGLGFAQLTRADLPRLFRPRAADAAFPADAVMPRAKATLAGLGIDLGALPNLTIDAREPLRKNPRPLALAVKVPGDVRLSYKPAGGVLEHARVMHELGHALHAAFTTEQRWELAKLGNPTVGEAWSALFEDLLEDPVWLEEHAGLTEEARAQHLAASSAHKLFLLRRAAGRLLFQLELHRQGVEDPRPLYRALLERTDGLPMTADDEARHVLDQEDFFHSADQFRAWMLAGQLQGQLKARFGPAWWRSPEAGAWLKGLWARGNALSARELAQAVGEPGIAPDVLLLRLGTALGVPMTLKAAGEGAEPAPAP